MARASALVEQPVWLADLRRGADELVRERRLVCRPRAGAPATTDLGEQPSRAARPAGGRARRGHVDRPRSSRIIMIGPPPSARVSRYGPTADPGRRASSASSTLEEHERSLQDVEADSLSLNITHKSGAPPGVGPPARHRRATDYGHDHSTRDCEDGGGTDPDVGPTPALRPTGRGSMRPAMQVGQVSAARRRCVHGWRDMARGWSTASALCSEISTPTASARTGDHIAARVPHRAAPAQRARPDSGRFRPGHLRHLEVEQPGRRHDSLDVPIAESLLMPSPIVGDRAPHLLLDRSKRQPSATPASTITSARPWARRSAACRAESRPSGS